VLWSLKRLNCASVCESDPDRASAIFQVTTSQLQPTFSALRLNLFESGFDGLILPMALFDRPCSYWLPMITNCLSPSIRPAVRMVKRLLLD
jgi:hypothetical protein